MSGVGFGPPWRIDGPPPLPPLYGLLQAADQPAAGVRLVVDLDVQPLEGAVERALEGLDIVAPGQERWMNGVEVYSYPPDLADVFDPCAAGSDSYEKGDGEEIKKPRFGAMTLWLAETCTTARVWDEASFKARAVAALSAVEGPGIASEFLTGARIPLNPHLSDGNGTFPNLDAATNPVNALALLEGEIAKSGRQGLIHCSPMLATTLVGRGFSLDSKTGVIRTINGTVVIPDFGYVNGATPKTHASPGATQEWMYATGPVEIRRSETFTMPGTYAEAIDRGSGGATNGRPNSVTYRAERYVLVDWDTEVQAAVLADRCLQTCSEGS